MISTVNGCGLCNAEHPPVGQWAGGTDQIFPPTLFVSPLAASQGREDRVSSPGRPPGGSHGQWRAPGQFHWKQIITRCPGPVGYEGLLANRCGNEDCVSDFFFFIPSFLSYRLLFRQKKKKRYWLAELRRQQGNTGLAAGCTVGQACLRRVFD